MVDVSMPSTDLAAARDEIYRLRAELSTIRYRGKALQLGIHRLSALQLILYNMLVEADGATVRKSAMVAALYGLDPNGGPEDPHATIYVHIHNMRKRLAGTGEILTIYGVGWAYRKNGDDTATLG